MSLALYTFGQFLRPAEDPANQGFFDLNDPIFEVVDATPGLIARSGYADEPGPEVWGEEVYPHWYRERGDGWAPATLSLWEDMEALFAFTYTGLHAEALKRGREWFEEPRWPPMVLWWHGADAPPTWSEAVARHLHLHEHGPSAFAFSFKAPFDVDGAPTRLDPMRLRQAKQRLRERTTPQQSA
ncbi:MAG: DUF3291 domain-containing protein [Pseudomonadota bacterium]